MTASAGPLMVFASGLLFATGLALSGMTDPGRVMGFLDVAGNWDPSLAFVMGGAIAIHSVLYRLILRRASPLFERRPFARGLRSEIDGRLVGGAAIFGLGWGLSGICPGPGIVSVATGTMATVPFVAAMLAGIWLHGRLDAARARLRSSESASSAGPAGS